MKHIATLAVLVSLLGACGAPPTSGGADETTGTSQAPLEGIPDGTYPVSVCGLRYEKGHIVPIRSAGGSLYIVSPDAAFGRPQTLVIPVSPDGSFSVVDYQSTDGGQVHTIAGSVSVTGGVLSIHYRVTFDFFNVTVAGRGIGSPKVATEIDGDGDGTYDLATGARSTCTVQTWTVTLSGTRTSSVPPHETGVTVPATIRAWGGRRTITAAGFDNVTIAADGTFSIEIPNPNGGSSYFRGTVKDGVVDAVYGTSSRFVTFEEHLAGFYSP